MSSEYEMFMPEDPPRGRKDMFYKQCTMAKETLDGPGICQYHTAWIPEQFAREGKLIGIKNGDGTWDEGWKVIGVHGRASEEYVVEHERDYKHQRKASDI